MLGKMIKEITMHWTNVGDINPTSGALLFKDAKIEASGDFTAEAIESICESAVGGDEGRFLLRSGTVYLAARNFASALDTVGAKLEQGQIIRPDHHGGEMRFDLTSPDGLREMFQAAHAFGGIDVVDIEVFVQIGRDQPYDAPHKFGTDPVIFRSGTSLWTIMERELEIGRGALWEHAAGKMPAPRPDESGLSI